MLKNKRLRIACISLFMMVFMLSFIGCQKEEEAMDTGSEVVGESMENEIVTEVTTEVEKVETEEVAEQDLPQEPYEIPKYELSFFEVPINHGLDFVKELKIGWNLGNTFDAFNNSPNSSENLDTETLWVGHKTTRENIEAIKNAGFETLRIPITWHNHLDEDFTISQVWLDRVQEVVDYGIESGLHVIINIHHDIDQKYYYPTPEYLESSKLYVHRIWEQLAKRFENYDEELIFEAVNEPRMVGTTNEWWLDFSKKECVDSVQVINELNQVFVDTVRSSGAKNKSRYLLVPGYAASPEGVLNEYFIIPEDIGENEHRIILSVHAYRPYSFALQGPSEKGSTEEFALDSKQQVDEILNFMDELYEKYIAKGVPVLLGEFGARNKNNNLEDRVRFSSFYIKSALERGMAACWWDNYAFIGNGENFGLLDRRLNLWVYDEIVDAMMQYFE